MTRPCFLVIDREYAGSISTRKLVVETAKLNVITAYSGSEALETLQRFPNLDGVVMDASLPDARCEDLVLRMKAIQPRLRIVVIGPEEHPCPSADYYLYSFDPARLLELLKKLEPERSAAIEQRNQELAKKEDENL